MAGLGAQIAQWQVGDKASLDEMLPAVDDELRRLARIYLSRERPGHSLQPTELVMKPTCAWSASGRWIGATAHFEIAAQTLRRVLLHHAESRDAKKREATPTASRSMPRWPA